MNVIKPGSGQQVAEAGVLQDMGTPLVQALRLTLERIRSNFGGGWLCVPGGRIPASLPGREPEALAAPSFGTLLEEHGFLEACICLQGSFALYTGEGMGYVLKPGDFCLLLPGAAHAEAQLPDYTAIWLAVDWNRSLAHLSGRRGHASFAVTDVHAFRTGPDAMRIVEGIRSEACMKNPYREDCLKAYAVQLLALFLSEAEAAGPEPMSSEEWKATIVGEAAAFVRANLSNRFLLADVAQSVCISANHLNALFKGLTGRTVMQHHEDCRVDAAKSMLADSGLSVNAIASKLGYYDQYHFSRAFKKATGLSPSAYRATGAK